MTNKMPIKELQDQIKALGDVLIFHAKRIKELEEDARPTPLSDEQEKAIEKVVTDYVGITQRG